MLVCQGARWHKAESLLLGYAGAIEPKKGTEGEFADLSSISRLFKMFQFHSHSFSY